MQKFSLVLTTNFKDPISSPFSQFLSNPTANIIPTPLFIQALLAASDQDPTLTVQLTNTDPKTTGPSPKPPAKSAVSKRAAASFKLPQLADVKAWTLNQFPWQADIERINKEVFKNESFRPNQRAIINATILGKDLFVLMPTGYGKSLCFQLPSVFNAGVTFVVSPLIALIQDQVNQMNMLGVRSLALYGGRQIELKLSQISEDRAVKLVYTTPETILGSLVFSRLRRIHASRKIERFVVDEAHCVSRWGNDFRKQFLELKLLRLEFPDVPMQTYTATASKEVIQDVVTHLKLKEPELFKASFNRKNLFIQVIDKNSELLKRASPEEETGPKSKGRKGKSKERQKRLSKAAETIAQMIRRDYQQTSGIIYCGTRKTCDSLAKYLSAELKGTTVASYHAGKNDSARERVLREFMNDEIAIVVATIAFGMGINKSDIRFVIHYNMPKALEDYYQEIGRAGRDGLPAVCTLFFDPGDKGLTDFFISHTKGSTAVYKRSKKTMMYRFMLFCEVR